MFAPVTRNARRLGTRALLAALVLLASGATGAAVSPSGARGPLGNARVAREWDSSSVRSAAKDAGLQPSSSGADDLPSTTYSAVPDDTGATPGSTSETQNAVSWTPRPSTYGLGSLLDQRVVMSDGTVLRADVYYPTDLATGSPARGPFPVLLQQTPYGKQNIASGAASAIANTDVSYFVERGYIVVIADVRGTGDSGGTWGLFDPVQATDGAALVNWAARLPQSDGKVGLFGESYMGINQFLTVSALGPDSPVKAMFPVISGNDLYRDTVTQGGLLDAEFSSFYLALVGGLNAANPVVEPLQEAAVGDSAAVGEDLGLVPPVELEHSDSLLQYDLPALLNIETGGDEAYDQSYWAQRNPVNVLEKVVADKIPAFLVGGWNDLFQRGELLNYTGLQNAYGGRPLLAPMTPTQAVTPRYQLMMGPWEHVTTGTGVDLVQIELEWFDTWLLGQDTPLAHTSTPLHLYELTSNRWVDTDRWPLTQTDATEYYFGPGRTGTDALSPNDGSLVTSPPDSGTRPDTVVFTGASSACDIQTDQWSAGLIRLASQSLGVSDPCDTDDITLGTGPGALIYTSAPFTEPEALAGPIDATVFATSTTKDVELVATIEEVPPSGQPIPLTSGALLGSFSEIDPADTWTGSDGAPLLPYHPYTQSSAEAVVPGEITRYDIEVFPTFAEVPPGWRIRLTLTTSDTPHLVPTLVQLPNLVGGVYQVEDRAGSASFVNLPLVPAGTLTIPCEVCG